MRKRGFVISIILLCMIPLILSGCGAQKNNPEVQSGIIDLKGYDLSKKDAVILDGDWRFYWKHHFVGKDHRNPQRGVLAPVPSTWNQYDFGLPKLPGTGFGTYYLQVQNGPPAGTLLGLRLRTVSSAYKVYIDQKYLTGSGTVGTSRDTEIGQYQPQTVFFVSPGPKFELAIEVSNYHYARGGLWDSIYLGTANRLYQLDKAMLSHETFLQGVLAIIGLFYMSIFWMLRELKYTLYFSLLALSAALVVDTAGRLFLISSWIPFRGVVSIWYGAPIAMTLFLILFVGELFPSKFSKWVVRFYGTIAVFLMMGYLWLDPLFYTQYATLSNGVEVLAILLALATVLIGARNGAKNGLLNAFSICLLLLGYIHDVFYLTNKINSPLKEVFYSCAFFALVIQMVTQAERIKTYFNNKASAELLLLQAQIKPHFLYNAINTIISIMRTDADKARKLLIDFSQYLRRSFDFKNSDQLVPLKDELELARAYIAIEEARFGDRLTISFETTPGIEWVRVPVLVLQPIIENAILHGILPKQGGGHVAVRIFLEGEWLSFQVKDDGVGMTPPSEYPLKSSEGDSVALGNIDGRIRKLFRQGLKIESQLGLGTTVTWRVRILKG